MNNKYTPVIRIDVLKNIINDNKEYSGDDPLEYFIYDFESYPEGWDCIFKDDFSHDELSPSSREKRKECFLSAINSLF